MTDIAISYEDGLRLSELQGQLSQLQYDLAHVDMASIGHKAIAIIGVTIVLAMVLMAICGFDENSRSRKVLCCTAMITAIVIVMILWGFIEHLTVYNIESEMANVQGQMDAIYTRYGGAT